jgi:HemY protein
MKGGLIIAAAAILGALLANILLTDPGYVALRFSGRLLEMSAITFAVLVIAAYFAVRFIIRVATARRSWKKAQVERRQQKARTSLARGVLELSEGEWEAAEKTLTRYVRDAEHPAAHYLVAARAAELQGSVQRRDEWLTRALESATDRRAPALIMQAEIHLKHKQLQAALATLEQLDARGEMNARGILLLARVHRQTGAWQRLLELEPRLRSARGIGPTIADDTVVQIYLDRLKAAGDAADIGQLESALKDIPKSVAQRPDIVVARARAAMACDEHESAEAVLRDGLERTWDESAVLTYGELEPDDPFRILERAESWLPEHEHDAALLLTCARLAARAELYGKARTYLETSIAIRPRLEAYQLLASLMDQLGERERAVKALNDALSFAVGRKTNLPKVRTRRWLDRRQQSDRRR